jgi:hypothetical protein
MPMAKRSIVLTAKQHLFLEKEAKRLGITISDLIRRIIDKHRDGASPDTKMIKQAVEANAAKLIRNIESSSNLLSKLKKERLK